MPSHADTLADRSEITVLSTTYACAVDQLDTDRLISTFTPDAVLEGPNFYYHGHVEIASIIAILDEMFVYTWHAVHNVDVRIDGDAATSETYCTARHLNKSNDDDREVMTMTIRYHDRLTKQDGIWKIARRSQTLEWIETNPVSSTRT
jgi:ketosteroid isomerase-like protein